MSEELVSISLRPLNVHLRVRRAPIYLRFVRNDQGKWDALDEPDDHPRPAEEVVAAKALRRGTVHIDRRVNGRHIGEWEECVEYEVVAEQPPEETLRDRQKWVDWCYLQHQSEKSQ